MHITSRRRLSLYGMVGACVAACSAISASAVCSAAETAQPAKLPDVTVARRAGAILAEFLGTLATPDLGGLRDTAQPGRVAILGHMGGSGSGGNIEGAGDFSAVVDWEHGFVCSVFRCRPPLASAPVSDGRAAEALAQKFARSHFCEWGGQTLLVRETHKGSGAHIFVWNNIAPSGACTGAWCSVIVDSGRGGVVSFVQQKALRRADDANMPVDAAEARAAAQRQAAKLIGPELRAVPTRSYLVLSYYAAPGYGPVWLVTMDIRCAADERAREVWVLVVCARTGKILATNK